LEWQTWHKKKKQDLKNGTDDLWTRNELQLKKMTLDLDLTATQQKRWAKLLPSKALKKSSNDKAYKDTTKIQLTADEKFAKKVEC
jgi:hypothetical protein